MLVVAAIKMVMYQEPQYTSVVAALNKQRATLLDINFAMPKCRKLLIDSVVETLKALYWDGNSNTASRGILTAFPNLAVIVYRECKFTKSVQLLDSIRVMICCTRRPHVLGGSASLYFKTKEDFLCFADYSGVSRMKQSQSV
uniref:Ankyrin repeat protein n=1 Tax=Strongyloides papillosus TaxID=174720 RepID=A0A0N5BHA9_STREA